MLTGLMVLALSPTALTDCSSVGQPRTVSLGQGRKATVQFDGQQVLVTIGKTRNTLPGYSCEETTWAAKVQLLDANFDGIQDFAVYDGMGYMGVNIYYQLYLSQKNSSTLVRSQVDPIEINNVSLDPMTKTVQYSQKSGPGMHLTTLCLKPDGKDLFVCRDTDLTEGARSADDWDFTWYAPNGKAVLTRKALKNANDDLGAGYFTVRRKTHFAPGYGAPVGKSYVVPGDRVEVLQIRGDWAQVRFTTGAGQVTAGWLALRDLG